jgi:putative oxidoreductase
MNGARTINWRQLILLKSDAIDADIGKLLLRVGAGGLMFWQHGLPKLLDFEEMMHSFADPLGIGPALSLALIVFAECVCAALVVLGLWTRLATIPLIIGMAVVVLVVQSGDPFAHRELPLMFLICFITVLLIGSGRYALGRA